MPTYIRVKDLPNAATSPAADDFILLSGAANGARRISRADFLAAVAGFYTSDPSTYKLATLDAGNKVLVSQLPSSAFSYQGTWAASTNTPTLANGTGTGGDTYYASDSGSVDFGAGSISFLAGDAVVYDGSVWQKVPDVVNLLDGKGTLDEAKTTLEIPDVGTAPDEAPLNQHLGSLAYQSAAAVSAGTVSADEIGVGVSDPNAKLHVSDETAPTLRMSRTGTGQIWQQSIDSNGRLIWQEAASEGGTKYTRAVLDDDGNFGIGTDSPDRALHCYSDSVATVLKLDSAGADTGLEFAHSDTVAAGINCSTGGDLEFRTGANSGAAERWRIDGSNGNLIASSGVGIDFGSGASTTLDDYEEGEHETTASPGVSGSITLLTTHDKFAYTKIGRSIIVTGFLKVDSVSSPTGSSVLFTLPTSTLDLGDNSGSFGSSVAYYDASTGAWNSKTCSADESSNNLFVHIDASTVAASDQFRIMVCYQSA